MIRVRLHLEQEQIDRLMAHIEILGKKALPKTNQAFQMVTRRIQAAWQGWAMGDELDDAKPIKNPSANLARSIRVEERGAFNADIYTNSPYMKQIQSGRKEYDLKEKLPYGRKSRVFKSGRNKGQPYVIVPFKWGTPNKKGGKRAHFSNFIEKDIHSFLEDKGKFTRSSMNGKAHFEKNFGGENILRAEYNWGDRLKADGNMNGMVAFPDEAKGFGSEYFTFRIISVKSVMKNPNSWIVPKIPANDVVGALERKCQPEAERLIEAGIKADLDME